MLTELIIKAGVHAQMLGLDPSTPPTNPAGNNPTTTDIVNSSGIQTWLATHVAPVLLAIFGVWILARSRRGNVGEVVTSSGITLLGIAFIGGAAVLPFLGDDIINLVIGH